VPEFILVTTTWHCSQFHNGEGYSDTFGKDARPISAHRLYQGATAPEPWFWCVGS